MGLFGALTSAVSGLQAQSFAMQNISGNIANSQTIAYKGIDTNFSDLISGSGDASQQVAGGVTASSVATNSVQGAIQSSTTATNMAINGDGYFTVQQPTGFSGTVPIFSGTQNYTRRGDFALNADGYLVNGSGFYLEGIPIDSTTGDPVGNVATPLNFQSNFLPASATTEVDYAVNLPATPQTTATSSLVANSNLLNAANFAQNPTLVATSDSNAAVTGTAALGSINLTGQGATTASITEGAFTTLNVSGGGDASNFTLNVDGTPTNVSITDANVTAYNTANAASLNSAALSAQDVANIINFQVGTNVATVNGGGNLVFASPTAGAGGSLTVSATSETTTGGTTGVANHATVTGVNATNLTFKVNNQTVTLAGGSNYNAAAIENAINTQVGGSANVNATLNGAGYLVITSTGTAGSGDSVTVNNFSSGDATQLGFPSATITANGANGLPATGQVIGSDAQTFVNETIDGGSLTVYDATGTPANLQFRWAKTDSVAAGGTDTWELFYEVNPNATGGQIAWQNSGTQFVFNSSGQLTPPINSITLNNVNIGGTVLGNLSVQTPSSAITQFANSSGLSTVNNLKQNGFAAGQLQTIAIADNGTVTGTFSNGQNVALADIPLVHFNSPSNLNPLTGGAYEQTDASGVALTGATGTIVGGSVEESNTDIATEFTKLIVTQQAYSANTKVITTANQMSQDLLDIIR
jgi:flagellar hook protein FlgE